MAVNRAHGNNGSQGIQNTQGNNNSQGSGKTQGSNSYDNGANYQNEMFNRSKDLKVQDGKNKLELKGIDNGNAYI